MQAASPVVQPDIAWAGRRGTGGTAGDKGSVELQEQRQRVSVTDAAMSIWRRATGKLFDLESRIVMQVRFPGLNWRALPQPGTIVCSNS